MTAPRIAIAGIVLESNAFAPVATEHDFRGRFYYAGDAIVDEATRRGIVVANVPDYCIEEVAEHAMAHFLGLTRKLLLSDRRVKAGEWSLSYVKPLTSIALPPWL